MQLKELAEVANIINSLGDGVHTISGVIDAVDGLSNANKIAVVTSSKLTVTQQRLALQTIGLSAEEAKNAVENAAMAASQTGATFTTAGLGLAFQGLAIKIKEVITLNDFCWILQCDICALVKYVLYDTDQPL